MPKTIAVLGTFDTKAAEFDYLVDAIRAAGAEVLTIDVSLHRAAQSPTIDFPCAQVAQKAGIEMDALETLPRNEGMAWVIKGAIVIAQELLAAGRIHGIISMGGSGGTTIGTSVMQSLPLGFPKVIVSTLAGTPRIGGYVAGKDICVLNSIVDVSGVNSISRKIYTLAAGAVVGGANNAEKIVEEPQARPRIATTMYGLTTPGVTAAIHYLEQRGYEVIAFHATGAGGRAMEALIREGFFCGVLDMTTTEVSAHVMDSKSSTAGEERMGGAALMGIPQVVCLGAMDMISTTEFDKYGGRQIYCHSLGPSHFRPNARDNQRIGAYLAAKLNESRGPAAVYIPKGGLSMIGRPGQQLYNPEADNALFDAIREGLDPARVELVEFDYDINDIHFAHAAAQRLDEMIRGR